jgi:hypothetical protein
MRIGDHRTRRIFDRYDVTSDADLNAAAEQTARYVDERRNDATRVNALDVHLWARSESEGGQNTDSIVAQLLVAPEQA